MSTLGKTALLLASLSVLCLWQYTQACSCEYPHPQRSLCAADFVMKAKVKGSKLLYTKWIHTVGNKTMVGRRPYQRVYHIRISKVFKETPAFMNVSHKHIYTSNSDAGCGIQLKNNTKYVLLGRISSGKAHIGLCDIHREWAKVPLRQRKGYAFLYEKNCQCKITNCFAKDCEKDHQANRTCNWNIRSPDSHCYKDHTLCQEQHDGQCRWSRTKLWKLCREKVKKQRKNEP